MTWSRSHAVSSANGRDAALRARETAASGSRAPRSAARAARMRRRRSHRSRRSPRPPPRPGGTSRRSRPPRLRPARARAGTPRGIARSRTSARPGPRPRATPSGPAAAGARRGPRRRRHSGCGDALRSWLRLPSSATTRSNRACERERRLPVAGRAVHRQAAVRRLRRDPVDQLRRVAGTVAAVGRRLAGEMILEGHGGDPAAMVRERPPSPQPGGRRLE